MTAIPADTGRRRPRFTVLVPTHNRADVLPFAIESALRQTEPDFELIVAGDGCTDNTADVVRAFSDARIRWMDLPKAIGIGYATRNVALRQTSGHYVAYLSHDDLWFPDHLARLGAVLDDTGAELAHSRLLGVDVDGHLRPYAFNLEVPSHCLGLERAQIAMSISCVAHRRSCLEKYGYWDEQIPLGGDVELWRRIAAGGEFRNLAFESEPTALHFVANWRATPAAIRRRHLARHAADGLLPGSVPSVLQMALQDGESAQQAAARRLRDDANGFVRGVRHGVVQYHDALLWRSHSTVGVMAFRAGAAAGALVDGLWGRIAWIWSPNRRQWREG